MNIQNWIENHPQVHAAIHWDKRIGSTASGGPYDQWSAKRKQLLQKAYDAAVNQQPTGLPDPVPNFCSVGDGAWPGTAISDDHAWQLYVTHVAHTLAVETEQRVPWSIATQYYDKTSLRILLDSRKFFTCLPTGGYAFDYYESGFAVPAPPDLSYAFLRDNDLIETPSEAGSLDYPGDTIGRVLGWCRDNMTHFSGSYTAKNMQQTWGYRGFTPVSRVISGTHNKAYNPDDQYNFRHWTGGCHGTTGFLRAVLRTINIPVQNTRTTGHSLAYFCTIKRYLSHSDDPYDLRCQRFQQNGGTLPWPAKSLLISPQTHTLWFGSKVSDATKKKNVSRRPAQLSIQKLPTYLLAAYCRDQKAGLSHAKGEVYENLKPAYSLKVLEGLDLWGKLGAKVQSLGGCANIPGSGA